MAGLMAECWADPKEPPLVGLTAAKKVVQMADYSAVMMAAWKVAQRVRKLAVTSAV